MTQEQQKAYLVAYYVCDLFLKSRNSKSLRFRCPVNFNRHIISHNMMVKRVSGKHPSHNFRNPTYTLADFCFTAMAGQVFSRTYNQKRCQITSWWGTIIFLDRRYTRLAVSSMTTFQSGFGQVQCHWVIAVFEISDVLFYQVMLPQMSAHLWPFVYHGLFTTQPPTTLFVLAFHHKMAHRAAPLIVAPMRQMRACVKPLLKIAFRRPGIQKGHLPHSLQVRLASKVIMGNVYPADDGHPASGRVRGPI